MKIANGKETIGVGLAGIRERLLQFGGRLEVHSGPVGTRVVASVPAAEGETAESTTRSAADVVWEQTLFRADEYSTRKRILVVDDHEVMRQGIRAMLADQEDLEVCGEAQDGLEAVLKTKELQPVLIIMDLTMPQAGGLTATYRIRERGSAPKILMFTTHEFDGLERMIEKSGCDGVVLKSNASQDLLRAVQAVLEGKRFFSREKMEQPGA